MKTLKSNWFDIALILLCGWWFFGWIFNSVPETIKLEGNAMWCFHSEYQSIKEYNQTEHTYDTSFIDITPNDGVRVFVHCDTYDK